MQQSNANERQATSETEEQVCSLLMELSCILSSNCSNIIYHIYLFSKNAVIEYKAYL